MVMNAVAFNMGGNQNAVQLRNESEGGFSDVLDSVNKSTAQSTAQSAAQSTAQSTAQRSSAEGTEEFSYTELRSEATTSETEPVAVENVSPEITEKAATVLEEMEATLKEAISQLVSKLKGETDEEAEDEIIAALLELLSKLQDSEKEDPEMAEVLQLLAAVFQSVKTENTEGTEIPEATENSEVTEERAVTEISPVVTEKSAEVMLIKAEPEAEMEIKVNPEAKQTTGDKPVIAEAKQVLPEVKAEDTPELPENKVVRLLDEILSRAKKELGLSEVKLTQAEKTVNPEVIGEKAQSMPLNIVHKDRSGELGEILGASTPETENVTTRTETDNAVHMAAELFQNVTAEAHQLRETPAAPVSQEILPPEIQTADEIIARMDTLKNGETEFTMVLNPESLGKITVKLVTAGEKVAVQITAENPETGRLLEARTENLQAVLRDNGVELERYQVVSERDEAELMQENYDGSSKNPYGRQEEQENGENDEGESFFDLLQSI